MQDEEPEAVLKEHSLLTASLSQCSGDPDFRVILCDAETEWIFWRVCLEGGR